MPFVKNRVVVVSVDNIILVEVVIVVDPRLLLLKVNARSAVGHWFLLTTLLSILIAVISGIVAWRKTPLVGCVVVVVHVIHWSFVALVLKTVFG